MPKYGIMYNVDDFLEDYFLLHYPVLGGQILDGVKDIERIESTEGGVIAILEDGTRVNVSDINNRSIVSRIRFFLEELSASDDLTEHLMSTLLELREILDFEIEELELATKKLDWAERILRERIQT